MKRIIFLIAIISFFIINFSFARAAGNTPKPKEPQPAKCEEKKGIDKGVCEALALKKNGMDESKIVELLLLNDSYKFGHAGKCKTTEPKAECMTGDQEAQLKQSFSDDFIDNWAGVPQYVTIGASAIFLARDSQVVAAGTLRIFFYPRNFYNSINTLPLSLCESGQNDCKSTDLLYNINPVNHDAWIHRIALTLGLTSAEASDNSATQNFYLAGLSYEVNRSALLNFGWAVSSSGSRGQIYFGITLDSNALKVLGVMK